MLLFLGKTVKNLVHTRRMDSVFLSKLNTIPTLKYPKGSVLAIAANSGNVGQNKKYQSRLYICCVGVHKVL